MLSIVLPIRLTDDPIDMERLVRLGIRSVDLFLDRSGLHEFIVVANTKDLEKIRSCIATSACSLPFRFLNENIVCPFFDSMGGSGWFRQQVIKIAVAKFVESKYLLVLDDDCIMTRPARMSDFFRDGRLLMSHIPVHAHEAFFRASCSVLQYPFDFYSTGEIIMNVTPEILVREVLLGIQREIEELWNIRNFGEWLLRVSRGYGDKPSRSIFAPVSARLFKRARKKRALRFSELREKCGEWTEYSLYWTYLKKHGLRDLYFDYRNDFSVPQIGDSGVWTDAEASHLNLDHWLARTFGPDQSHYFSVVSSKITQIDWRQFIDRVSERLSVVS